MAELGVNFNANDVDPQDGNFDPIPNGWYPAFIEKTERKTTKDGTGWYINFTYSITGDHYANRKIFDIMNLGNANQQAAEIAWRSLSAICHAVEKLNISDADELLNIPLMVKVGTEAAVMMPDGVTEKYAAKNTIKAWKNVNDNSASPAPASPQPSPAATPAANATGQVQSGAGAKPPWEQ